MAKNKESAEALEEYEKFLAKYSLRRIQKNSDRQERFARLLRRLLALIIWRSAVTARRFPVPAAQRADFRLYFREFISDVSQAMFLWNQGVYKPALLTLRSGVENFVRCLGMLEDPKVLSLTSVHQLFDAVRASNIVQATVLQQSLFQAIEQQYGDLCRHVHTADAAHMALVTAVGTFPRFAKRDADRFKSTFDKFAVPALALMAIRFRAQYFKLHHRDFDLVADQLPRQVKAALAG